MATQIAKTFVEVFGKQYPADGFTNITPKLLDLAGRRLHEQQANPLRLISDRIRDFFRNYDQADTYKYDEFSFKFPVVTIEDNFDSLLIPKDHVSRKKSDTYYLNAQYLFRSHTSAHQVHCLNRGSRAFISIADCYRRDEIDRSHFPVFHQCEIFKLYDHKEVLRDTQARADQLYDVSMNETETKQGIYTQQASSFTEEKLKTCVESFVKDFFHNPDLKTRWVPAYFPFTHPSFELEILWRDKWLEILGCGIVRDQILEKAGIREHIGFAAGLGLERFGMLKYQIPDIRLFWSKDTGFSSQFENKSPFDEVKFVPFSNCPQCINDLSFWLPDEGGDPIFESNDFYDLCRSIGGELIEQIRLLDTFIHPRTKRTSHCYRIVYRAADRVLTKDEVNVLHEQIAESCKQQFKVQLR